MSDNKVIDEMIDEFVFQDDLLGEKQNKWLKVNIYKIVHGFMQNLKTCTIIFNLYFLTCFAVCIGFTCI